MRIDRSQVPTGPLFLQASIDENSIDDESRSINFLASDESIDRYGDIVKSTWNLSPFKKNPVFLWNHDQSLPAIGTVQPIGVENKRLMVTANFTDEGVNPFSDQLFRMVKARVLRAVSVGFTVAPTDVELIRNKEDEWTGGYKYNNPELLELSLCNVGANAHALAVARSLGVPSAFINRAIVPDALIEQQQRKIFLEIVGARVRKAKIYGPR
jgi:HK97 family phage prohead protease